MLRLNIHISKNFGCNRLFQYILCCGWTWLTKIEDLDIPEFQYILCCGWTVIFASWFMIATQFQYILCCGWTTWKRYIPKKHIQVSIHLMLRLNSVQGVQVPCLLSVSIHLMLRLNEYNAKYGQKSEQVSIHLMLRLNPTPKGNLPSKKSCFNTSYVAVELFCMKILRGCLI